MLAAPERNVLCIISAALSRLGYPALLNRYGAGAHFDARQAQVRRCGNTRPAKMAAVSYASCNGCPLREWISA